MLEHLDPEAVRKEIDPELLSVEANDTAIQLLLVSLLTKSAMNLEHALRTIGATSDSSMSTQRGGRTDGCIPATKPERES